MADKSRKLIDILNMSSQYLSDKQIEFPRLSAELLISHVLKMSRVQLYLNYGKPLTDQELDGIRIAIKRRSNHEPVQYITGETDFFSLPFKVNRFTLIPRPETELLVEKSTEECLQLLTNREKINVLDIGTGSGNIAICIAKNVPNAYVTAIDVRDETLDVAQKNAKLHDVEQRLTFIKADIFNSELQELFSERFDIIVSNPPYISKEELNILPPEVRNYEPYIALYGGEDGLRFYRRVLKISTKILKHRAMIGFELGYNQVEKVKNLVFDIGFSKVDVFKDLNGIERVIIIKINEHSDQVSC